MNLSRILWLPCVGILVLFMGISGWANFSRAEPFKSVGGSPRVIILEEEPPLTGFDMLPSGTNPRLFSLPMGESTELEVTGSLSGPVWGSIVYTSDSNLSAAAVHAGLLAEGETGRVKVTMLPGRQDYEGSNRHGVTSLKYGRWHQSYWLEAAKPPPSPTSSVNLSQYRGQHGKVLELTLTGAASGSVWGNEVYTDDSDLGTAAVHAGVLEVGQTAKVKVTIVPGRSRYRGTEQNGVRSRGYSAWRGSFWMEPAMP